MNFFFQNIDFDILVKNIFKFNKNCCFYFISLSYDRAFPAISSGADIRPHSPTNIATFFPNCQKKNPNWKKNRPNRSFGKNPVQNKVLTLAFTHYASFGVFGYYPYTALCIIGNGNIRTRQTKREPYHV